MEGKATTLAASSSAVMSSDRNDPLGPVLNAAVYTVAAATSWPDTPGGLWAPASPPDGVVVRVTGVVSPWPCSPNLITAAPPQSTPISANIAHRSATEITMRRHGDTGFGGSTIVIK